MKVNCINCNILFNKKEYDVKRRNGKVFCSKKCYYDYLKRNSKVNCKNCNKEFFKSPKEQLKTKNNFCCKSCATTYNNKNKTHGTRVSKLELFLQNNLLERYCYDFHFNRKDTINSELDIYIPELKLAFELNGIFHYEPIYGEEKLNQIQNNDNRKFQACLEKGIELCIIDTSWIKYNTLSRMNKVLDIVEKVIKLSSSNIQSSRTESN